VSSQIFATQTESAAEGAALSMADQPFGTRRNGRYKMPLLAGETGIKALPRGAVPWVPGGLMSTTEMVSAFAESRALNIWEQEQAAIGMATMPSIFEELVLDVAGWRRAGVDFQNLREHPEVRRKLTGGGNRELAELSIMGRAKAAAGANEAREAGTHRHTAWEHFGKTGELIGTPEMQRQIRVMAELLNRHGFQIVPELSERVIRNCEVKAAGRFDNVLLHVRTDRFLMADLKTKKKAFFTHMEVDAQLATYAYAEWMLEFPLHVFRPGEPAPMPHYVPGPRHHVDLTEGVVLVMPSNGAPPYLRRADLVRGWRTAQLARLIVDERAAGKSAERLAMAALPYAESPPANLPQTT
jgi:hypothetical protein